MDEERPQPSRVMANAIGEFGMPIKLLHLNCRQCFGILGAVQTLQPAKPLLRELDPPFRASVAEGGLGLAGDRPEAVERRSRHRDELRRPWPWPVHARQPLLVLVAPDGLLPRDRLGHASSCCVGPPCPKLRSGSCARRSFSRARQH